MIVCIFPMYLIPFNALFLKVNSNFELKPENLHINNDGVHVCVDGSMHPRVDTYPPVPSMTLLCTN